MKLVHLNIQIHTPVIKLQARVSGFKIPIKTSIARNYLIITLGECHNENITLSLWLNI